MKTIFVAAILVVGALVAYALPTQVFADESETDTEQELKQKNYGSGDSTNFNCGENNIDATIPIQACGTVDLGEEGLEALAPLIPADVRPLVPIVPAG